MENLLNTIMEKQELFRKESTAFATKGNKAAGVRLRKSLRHLKSHTGDFVKFTLNKD